MEEKESLRGLKVVSVDRKELLIGTLLISISFFMPLFFNVHNFSVLSSLFRSLTQGDQLYGGSHQIYFVALCE